MHKTCRQFLMWYILCYKSRLNINLFPQLTRGSARFFCYAVVATRTSEPSLCFCKFLCSWLVPFGPLGVLKAGASKDIGRVDGGFINSRLSAFGAALVTPVLLEFGAIKWFLERWAPGEAHRSGKMISSSCEYVDKKAEMDLMRC